MDNQRELLPNTVAEMALSSVDRYEKLNAPTLEKADEKFTKQLISVLQHKTVGRKVGEGGSLMVNELVGNEDVVVKRLDASTRQEIFGEQGLEEYWIRLQKEHALAQRYFGRRFIPYTEFLVVDGTNFDDPNPDMFVGREYVMVQEGIPGMDFHKLYGPLPLASPRFKTEITEFIKRYETMMREENVTIENQIMIAPQKNSIKVSDTNRFISLKENIARGANLFQKLGIDVRTIETTEDIINVLVTKIPAFAPLAGASYSEIMKACDLGSNLARQADIFLSNNYGGDPNFDDLMGDFDTLLTTVENFAPAGEHNSFIQNIMGKFGITDNDINTPQT